MYVLDTKKQSVRVKNYSQRIKMLLKTSASLDIERVCNLKNELKEIHSIVQKRRKIKSE